MMTDKIKISTSRSKIKEDKEVENKLDELTELLDPVMTITSQPTFTDWQFVYNPKNNGGFYVRTMYRMVRNVIQLIRFAEIHKNQMQYPILEFNVEQGIDHTQMEKWRNIEPEERMMPPEYADVFGLREHYTNERKKFPKLKIY